jgi:hypothetical protein
MDNMLIKMISNRKKEYKNTKEIFKEIENIIEKYNVEVDITDTNFDYILEQFILNYVHLIKIIEIKKNEIENHKIVNDLINDIITKIENNDFIIPELNKKKIILEEKCIKHYKNNNKSNFNVIMSSDNI